HSAGKVILASRNGLDGGLNEKLFLGRSPARERNYQMRFSMNNKVTTVVRLNGQAKALLVCGCLISLAGKMGHPGGVQAAILPPALRASSTVNTALQLVPAGDSPAAPTNAPISGPPDLAVTGTVTVTIQPPEVVADGARWTIDNGPERTSGFQEQALFP